MSLCRCALKVGLGLVVLSVLQVGWVRLRAHPIPGAWSAPQASSATLTVLLRIGPGSAFDGSGVVTLSRSGGEFLRSGSIVSGRAVFDGLAGGTYLVFVSAPGYKRASERVDVVGSHQDEEITLEPELDSRIAHGSGGPPLLSPRLQKELAQTVEALRAGRLDQAQKHVTTALRLAPSNPDVNFVNGLCLERTGNLSGAGSSWEKALSLEPKHLPSVLALGQLSLRGGQLSDAKVRFLRVLELDPNSWRALSLLAMVYLRQKAYPEAVHAAERSLQLGKGQAEAARLVLAEAYIAQNDLPRATDTLNTFLKSNPSATQLASARRLLNLANDKSAQLVQASAPSPALVSVSDSPAVDLSPGALGLPSWFPANVDDAVPQVDTAASCSLDAVLASTARRVEQFTSAVDRFTATESLEEQVVDPWGSVLHEEQRNFTYMVSISQRRLDSLSIQEYRNGTQDLSVFPDEIATVGLPSIVLIFHPLYRDDYEMICEGLGTWNNAPAWQIYFRQRPDKASRMRGYRTAIDRPSIPVALKGRAWIDAETSQVVRIETDLIAPVPEIKLSAEHQNIEFGPVHFASHDTDLWLPKTADIYFEWHGRRYRRRNTFRNFLLFSVDDKQTISAPGVTTTPDGSPGKSSGKFRSPKSQ